MPWSSERVAGDPATDPFVDRSYAFVIGHNWVIGGNKTNRVYLGETVENPPPKSVQPGWLDLLHLFRWHRTSARLYSLPQSKPEARRIPVPMIGDDFSWTKGSHTLPVGRHL